MTIREMKAKLRAMELKYRFSPITDHITTQKEMDIEFLAKTCIFLLEELNLNPDIEIKL